jgi:site-specific recombinase XerD
MLNGFLDDYLTYCKTLALAANSTKELTRYIKQLDAYLVNDGPTKLAQLQYKHLVNFAISNQAAPTTVKARIWAMKKFFSFLHLHDYIKDNIAINLSPPKIPKKETRFLTQIELKIVFATLAGLRKSSAVALNVEDFDAQNHRLMISEKGLPGKRIIQIPSAISALLNEYIGRCDIKKGPLFLSRKKQRLKSDGVNKIVDQIKKRLLEQGHAFAQTLHPHIFRHSAGTQLNEVAGFSITKGMLGHRNAQNTRKYIHLSPVSYGAYMKRHPYFSGKGDLK